MLYEASEPFLSPTTWALLWFVPGFAAGVFMIWSSGDDIEIGDLFWVFIITMMGPILFFVILAKIINDTKFWKIVIFRRRRKPIEKQYRG